MKPGKLIIPALAIILVSFKSGNGEKVCVIL